MLKVADSCAQKGATTSAVLVLFTCFPITSNRGFERDTMSLWFAQDIPFPEAGRAAEVGLPLPLVVDFAEELFLWLSSELTKASLSLFTSTWAVHSTTAGEVLQAFARVQTVVKRYVMHTGLSQCIAHISHVYSQRETKNHSVP